MSAAAASVSFPALGSTAVLWVTEAAALGRARELLARELEAIDHACSRFRLDSELWCVNCAGGRPVEVSELLLVAVEVALRAAEATEGLVDPTIGRSLRLAGYDRTFALVGARSCTVRRAAVPAVGWRAVELDRARRTLRLPPGVELDLGATAKALAADRAAQAVSRATAAGVLVGLGGDIAVAGAAPAAAWPVRIADDHAAGLGVPGPTVAISSGGLTTSSVTVRRWQTRNGNAHHIIDPGTGVPAETPWRTVSVAAGSCVDANLASTAAILLGERAPRWLTERALPARLVHSGGLVVTVGGWPEEAS